MESENEEKESELPIVIKHIQAGKLTLHLSQGQERFDELIGLASRENQKRGFLFVSKVLGKHVPVKPSVMRKVYDELAARCCQQGDIIGDGDNINASNIYVIGMAETATGLGAGFADSLAQQNPQLNVFYQHTTRHILADHQQWFSLCESHSHAVDHILYHPNQTIYDGISKSQCLVLVDDEMTTGKTLLQLAKGVLRKIPSIKKVIIVTLVSWLDSSAQKAYEQLPASVEFVQIIKGQFSFEPDPAFSAQLPESVDRDLCEEESRDDLGRTGLKMPYRCGQISESFLPLQKPAVVVGTGEHLYYPFLVAEHLEKTADIVFQSTTRSPILKGDAIERKTSFSAGGDKMHYIYNLPADRTPIILCETDALRRVNGLLRGDGIDIT